MGKFELAPAVDIRLEPIKETLVYPLPHRIFRSWGSCRFDRKRPELCVPREIRPTVRVDK